MKANVTNQERLKPPLTPPVIPLWGTEGGEERISPPRTPPGERGKRKVPSLFRFCSFVKFFLNYTSACRFK